MVRFFDVLGIGHISIKELDMPKAARELSALAVKRLQHPHGGRLNPVSKAVGGVAGLYLQLSASGAKSWLLKVQLKTGKRRELGLGPYPEVGLGDARDKAREYKAMIREGLDPMLERQKLKAELQAQEKASMTFAEALAAFVANGEIQYYSTDKSRKRWVSTMNRYAVPTLGNMRVGDIGTEDVLEIVEPIWASKHDTAQRVLGRIRDVLDWAEDHGHYGGPNPALWSGALKRRLVRRNKDVAAPVGHGFIAVDDIPTWFAQLRAQTAESARALEFLTLAAARSGEVRGALWSEIDLDKGVWTIPAERMKMSRAHRVPLTTAAIALLQALPRDNDLIFPALRGGQMSDMTLSALMKRMHGTVEYLDAVSGRPAVPHGLRSSFKSWAMESTAFPNELSEMALAHKVGSAVEQAYARSDMMERRRVLMEAWSNHLHGVASAEVVKLHGAANG